MTCCSCTRPILLSAAEKALLGCAAGSPEGVEVADPARRDAARMLVRMGYLVRRGRSRYLATDRGRERLDDLPVGCVSPTSH